VVVAEPVVAELVEASKHRNDHRERLTKMVASTGSATGSYQILKIDFRDITLILQKGGISTERK